ncbi:MAG: hypothetical protein NTU91_11980 [Chloroflexi bacterium]|nr:hypothetical protein [Chloroflexota bacterium]
MKTISRTRKWLWTTAGGLLVLALTAAAFVVVPAAPAYADEEDPPSTERSRDRGTLLERAFEREQDWLSRQSDNLARAGTAADKAGELIERAKERGVDTGDLEAALAELEGQLAAAEVSHDEAAAIIDAHAGFNGGGKVTDQEPALETVKSAGAALREAREALKGTAQDLRDAVKAWRDTHPRPQPTAEPTGA